MVYKEHFVAVVKSGNKILREHNPDSIYLPFGAEYSVLLKNLESRKAAVKVTIDGTDVLNGGSLIIHPNSETELDRFLDSMDKGARFRFIEKTQQISDHRGDRIDDGVIRIEFQYEADYQNWSRVTYTPLVWTGPFREVRLRGNEPYCGETVVSCYATMASSDATQHVNAAQVKCDEGITVPGSTSHSKFTYDNIGALESNSHVIILRLHGTGKAGKVMSPITVRTKIKCPTCGTKNKSINDFCYRCATALLR